MHAICLDLDALICCCNVNGSIMRAVFNWYVSACFCFDELALSEGEHWGLSRHLFLKFATEFTLQRIRKIRKSPQISCGYPVKKKDQLYLTFGNISEMYYCWV